MEEEQRRPKTDRSVRYVLTKYEKARILGGRALQLSLGAFPMVEVRPNDNSISIGERELDAGVLPIIIRRRKPDGSYDDVVLRELYGKTQEQTT